MKRHWDAESDALYLRLDQTPIVESQEAAPGVVLEYSADGQVVGLEILGLSKRVPKAELQRLVFETSAGAESIGLEGEGDTPYGASS
jgi:uncharacterized protein YuzE